MLITSFRISIQLALLSQTCLLVALVILNRVEAGWAAGGVGLFFVLTVVLWLNALALRLTGRHEEPPPQSNNALSALINGDISPIGKAAVLVMVGGIAVVLTLYFLAETEDPCSTVDLLFARSVPHGGPGCPPVYGAP